MQRRNTSGKTRSMAGCHYRDAADAKSLEIHIFVLLDILNPYKLFTCARTSAGATYCSSSVVRLGSCLLMRLNTW